MKRRCVVWATRADSQVRSQRTDLSADRRRRRGFPLLAAGRVRICSSTNGKQSKILA